MRRTSEIQRGEGKEVDGKKNQRVSCRYFGSMDLLTNWDWRATHWMKGRMQLDLTRKVFVEVVYGTLSWFRGRGDTTTHLGIISTTSFVTNNRLRDSTWNAHWQKLPKHANVVVGCSIRNLHSIGKSIICNQWHCVAGHLFITVFKAVPELKSFLDKCLSLAICSDLAQNLGGSDVQKRTILRPKETVGKKRQIQEKKCGGTYTFDMYHCIVFNNRCHHLHGRGYFLKKTLQLLNG